MKAMKFNLTRKTMILSLVLVLFAILPIFVSSSYIINLMVLALLYGVLSSAWNFVSGFAVSLALATDCTFPWVHIYVQVFTITST